MALQLSLRSSGCTSILHVSAFSLSLLVPVFSLLKNRFRSQPSKRAVTSGMLTIFSSRVLMMVRVCGSFTYTLRPCRPSRVPGNTVLPARSSCEGRLVSAVHGSAYAEQRAALNSVSSVRSGCAYQVQSHLEDAAQCAPLIGRLPWSAARWSVATAARTCATPSPSLYSMLRARCSSLRRSRIGCQAQGRVE